MDTNVIELQVVRDANDQKLFDAHRASITEFICAYAHHMNEPNSATLERFLDAQEQFGVAWRALEP
jgi:hypothetical protein